jgi:hypothetical protein
MKFKYTNIEITSDSNNNDNNGKRQWLWWIAKIAWSIITLTWRLLS